MTGGVVNISRYDEELAAQAAVEEAFSPPPEMTDGAIDATYLIRRAAEGHRWAWERLVAKYSRLIWAMTRDFKLSESDASDVVQATWLRLA